MSTGCLTKLKSKVTRLIVDEVMNPNISPDQTVVTIMPNASNSALERERERERGQQELRLNRYNHREGKAR